MAVELITGVPRAGKSYYAVNLIASRCCYKDDGVYVVNEDTVIISNIDGLDVNHISLTDLMNDDCQSDTHIRAARNQKICECGGELQLRNGKYGPFYSCIQCRRTQKASGADAPPSGSGSPASDKYEDRIEKVISESAFKKFREQYGDKKIYIVIDECQQYLHTKFYSRNVFYGFEIHGHYGIDIILIAHHVSKISSQIVNICEYETRIVPRRLQIGNTVQYLEKQGRSVVGRGMIRKKQEIFDLYKSQYFKESRIKKSRMHLYVILFFLISLAAVFYLKHRFFSKIESESAGTAYASQSPASAGHVQNLPMKLKLKRTAPEPLYSASFSVVGSQIYIFTHNAYYRVQECPYPAKIIRRSGRIVSVLLSGYSPPAENNNSVRKERNSNEQISNNRPSW